LKSFDADLSHFPSSPCLKFRIDNWNIGRVTTEQNLTGKLVRPVELVPLFFFPVHEYASEDDEECC
jgi:hypothetical protein